MNFLVTGGAGFIGCNFIEMILREFPNARVVCLDKLTYAGNISNVQRFFADQRFSLKIVDICDGNTVENIFKEEKPDYVVNFAAESHVDRSIDNPSVFFRTNIVGTSVLLDACRKYGVQRFHQVSTDEVYGDLPLERKEIRFTETMPIKASSPYSASKASADLIVMSYYRTYNLPVSISRCSNNYGPYQHREKLIPLMITNALVNQKLPVYGKGINVRDWIHVSDHCQGIVDILIKGNPGEIYNIGGNNECSNIVIVEKICKYLEKPISLIEFVEDRKGHDLRYAIDSSKIQNQLNWRQRYDFEKGLKETIQWYIDNKDWWLE